MEHEEIESLLGAYALDAVEPEEARLIEEHVATCPRCRAELAAHREIGALLGNGGTQAPEALWERIAAGLIQPAAEVPQPSVLIARLGRSPSRKRRLVTPILATAAAVIAIALLSAQVIHLDRQVHHLSPGGVNGPLASAVSSALGGAHATVTLSSNVATLSARVVVVRGGSAYWVSSDLKTLPSGRTYQLWGLSRGRVVSLGLLGADAGRYAAFRVEKGVTMLMVTSEPSGGTPTPTTPVLLAGVVPPHATT